MGSLLRFRGLSQLGRWHIFAYSTLCLIIIQLFYYWLDERMISAREELNLLVGLALQVAIGILISQGNWKVASATTSQPLTVHRFLNQKLVGARGLNEISSVLLGIANTFVPLVGASYIKYDQKTGRCRIVDEWSAEGRPLPIPVYIRAAASSKNNASITIFEQGPVKGFFFPGKTSKQPQGSKQFSVYCLRRPYRDSQIALLCLYFPPQAAFNQSQFALLNEIALETEMAVERAQLRKQISSQTAEKKVEHERIARYLHDTLGQNLAYLRMKLDQLSGEDALQNIISIQQEIERMRDIADLAYEQMRNSLSDLREEPVPELTTAIEAYAAAAGDRAGFEVRLQSEGKARTLPAYIQRQILYILREALRNIEKHAQAGLVRINLIWTEADLTLAVCDDGVGFDVEAARKKPGHFGLKIMDECALEIKGSLEINAQGNTGAKITLNLPFRQQTPERTFLPVSISEQWLEQHPVQPAAGDTPTPQSAFEGNR